MKVFRYCFPCGKKSLAMDVSGLSILQNNSTDLESIVSPRRKLHSTVLLVKRKIFDIDRTRAAKYHHRQPRDVTVRRHDDVRAN
jgi:hypothetical protein